MSFFSAFEPNLMRKIDCDEDSFLRVTSIVSPVMASSILIISRKKFQTLKNTYIFSIMAIENSMFAHFLYIMEN